MTWVAVSVIGTIGGIGATLWASQTQADAIEKASKVQADATREATDLQRTVYDQQRQDIDPWRTAGVNALGQLSQMANDGTTFGMDQFQADPGYAFRMAEGMKALERSAAARGGLLSGATLKGVQDFGQVLASQEYQNAFNRYHTERNSRLNQLQALAGVGQTAVGQMNHAGQNYANNASDLTLGGANTLAQGYVGGANARASGYMGMANTLNNALGSYIGYSQNQALMDRMFPQQKQPILGTTGSTVPTQYTSGY